MPTKIVHPIETKTFSGDCRTWPPGVYTSNNCGALNVFIFVDGCKDAYWIDPGGRGWLKVEFCFARGAEVWKRVEKITLEFS